MDQFTTEPMRERPGETRAWIKLAGQHVLQGSPPIPEIEV
jgi:hypothetical protein